MTFDQVKSVEAFYGVELPAVYKEFLLLMGKGAGGYMRGSSVFYDDIFQLGEWGIELAEENEIDSVPQDAFFFWLHQGYQAAYFRLSDGDDPPVYFFSEGKADKRFIVMESSLTDFFLAQLVMSYSDLSGDYLK